MLDSIPIQLEPPIAPPMKIKYVSGLLLVASAFVAVAQAQQVVSYYADIPNVTAGSPQQLELPGFDSSLGDLTEVKLTYSGELWQSVFGENTGNNPNASYDLMTAAQLALAKSDGLTLFSSPSYALNRKGTVGAFDGKLDFGDISGVRFNQNVETSGIYIDPDLAHYKGVDAIDFKATVKSLSQFISDANFAKGSSLSSSVALSVDYTFTPFTAIPEPPAYAALIGAMVLVGVSLKRRQIAAV